MRLPLAIALVACTTSRPPAGNEYAPGVVFPTSLGEGSDQGATAGRAPRGATTGTATEVGGGGGTSTTSVGADTLPDPEPLRQAEQWRYQIEHVDGTLRVAVVEPVTFAQPVVTARRMGRYAIELWIGTELIDRVRFDLPLLAVQPEDGSTSLAHPPDLGSGVRARATVLVPASRRARRAVLVDRATREVIALPWPPDRPLPAAPAPD